MKRILWIAGSLLLVLVAATIWLGRSLEGIVERSLERVGSELLGTRVSVDGVSIDLGAGRGTIRGLRVRNPEGFSGREALSLDEIALEIDAGSVASGPIVLNLVSVRAPQVLAEAAPAGLNLEALRRNVARAGAAEADAEVADAGAEPRRIRIRRFVVEEGGATSDMTAVGGEVHAIDVPGLSLRDVGGASGATPGELGKRILEAWLSRIATAAAAHQARRAVGEAVDEALEEGARKAGEALKGLFD